MYELKFHYISLRRLYYSDNPKHINPLQYCLSLRKLNIRESKWNPFFECQCIISSIELPIISSGSIIWQATRRLVVPNNFMNSNFEPTDLSKYKIHFWQHVQW